MIVPMNIIILLYHRRSDSANYVDALVIWPAALPAPLSLSTSCLSNSVPSLLPYDHTGILSYTHVRCAPAPVVWPDCYEYLMSSNVDSVQFGSVQSCGK